MTGRTSEKKYEREQTDLEEHESKNNEGELTKVNEKFVNTDILFTDNENFFLGLLGFWIPVAGFILFLLEPKIAKAAGIGAFVSVIVVIVLYVLEVVVYAL